MAIRIDVVPTIPDARAALKRKAFRDLVRGKLTQVHIADSYIVDTTLTKTELDRARSALTNPLVESSTVGRWIPKRFDVAIEIGFLPGVTDNVGATAKQTIEDSTGRKFKEGEHVYSSQVFFLEGKITEEEAREISLSLHNPLIQSARISGKEISKLKNAEPKVPRVVLDGSARVLHVDLEVGDYELERIGTSGITDTNGNRRGPLALSIEYLHAIRDHFRHLGRKPTDVELESLAQTWSEHCKHTIFASAIDDLKDGLYKTYIKGATAKIRKSKGKKDFTVSVFKDNSGGIVFDEAFIVSHKVETHNTPSALDPFGGAITGIVGVNRDALGFGLGAKPVANVYGFCFAPPDDMRRLFRDGERTQEMLSARRIADGVIRGINAGGNQSGIPTPHGFMLFDSSYRGKPLVFAGTVGLIPKRVGERKLYEKKALPGDYIVIVGGRTGADGIHGATFSSVSLDSGSPSTAVQIGDPITQKKLSDVIAKEARDMELYNSITDNGAGGFSSSISEMARESGGCKVDLEKAPLKYPGLEPWQIWISESQERMTLAVPKKKWKTFQNLMRRRGVEATIIGVFTKSGMCRVTYKGKNVVDLSMDFLHNGLPKKHFRTMKPVLPYMVISREPKIRIHKDLSGAFLSMLSRFNLAGQDFLHRQFDHEVQGGSVIKPVQGAGRVTGDASIFRPVLSSNRGVVLSSALTPFYSDIDPYRMAAAAIDTAIRNTIVAGGTLDHLALLDNFCWTESTDPKRLWQLKEAARACYDYAVLYGTPFISGKDSMFNDFKGYDEKGLFTKISALPTLLISTIGVIEDAMQAVSIGSKVPGDLVYVLGETHDELGGSEYFRMISDHGQEGNIGGTVPKVDGKKNVKLYRAFTKASRKGLVASAVSVHRGGLAYALSRMSLASKLGLDVDISKISGSARDNYVKLFSESMGRIVVTVSLARKREFEKLFVGIPVKLIGKVTKRSTLLIRSRGKKLVSVSLDTALAAYRKTFATW